MTTILRFILFFLLVPAFAIVAQAAEVFQDDFRIVDADSRNESIILESIGGVIYSYDSSGALLQQHKSIDGEDCSSGYQKLKTSGAEQPLFSFFAELVATNKADDFVDVYRAFGDDARAQGFSWTTKDPRTVSNFRDAAGLPSGGASGANNSADFLIQGRAKVQDVIKFKSADPLDGNVGGLPELIIDPKNVNITDFSVLKQ